MSGEPQRSVFSQQQGNNSAKPQFVMIEGNQKFFMQEREQNEYYRMMNGKKIS